MRALLLWSFMPQVNAGQERRIARPEALQCWKLRISVSFPPCASKHVLK